jgi:hypothetical protein
MMMDNPTHDSHPATATRAGVLERGAAFARGS